MSIGKSGRVVIEIEPDFKRQLYAALARDGLTLKSWFLSNAQSYMAADRGRTVVTQPVTATPERSRAGRTVDVAARNDA